MKKEFTKDKLKVCEFETRQEMGKAAANDIELSIADTIAAKGECRIIFAAAPSQNDVLAALVASDKIDWAKVYAYHMDEYIGLPESAPQNFAHFLKKAIFEKLAFAGVEYINGRANPEQEAQRYTNLLQDNPPDIVIMGIGENGHIAFNDPHVALFNDTKTVKSVVLDEACRKQQVNDGCFDSIELVPTEALTLTIPALIAPEKIFCIVPGPTKAQAVYNTLNGEITETCPASIIRNHPCATLYIDKDSAGLL